MGARVFLVPRSAAGKEMRESWLECGRIHDQRERPLEDVLGGAWRPDGSGCYGGKAHVRHERAEYLRGLDASGNGEDLPW